MSDQTVNGPGGDGAPAPDAPDNRTQLDSNPSGGSQGAENDWVAGLQSEDNRTLVEQKQWKSPDDALRSYRELHTHASKALTVPGEDATAEDWDKFHKAIGRPDKPDDYDLQVKREDLPEDFPYDESAAVELRNWGHELGLTERQLQGIHDKFVSMQAGTFSEGMEAVARRETDAHRELVKEWGDPDTEGYKTNVELMSRAARQLKIADSLKEAGVISQDGGIRDAGLAKALARVGKTMFAEDSYASGNGAGTLKNPFSDEHLNMTQQGQIINSDPGKAKSLIRAAGKDPAKYGL